MATTLEKLALEVEIQPMVLVTIKEVVHNAKIKFLRL
jgi:hypothetical protein